MKVTLFVCFMLCCATLVSTATPWRKMLKKLKQTIKPDTDFVHVVSAHEDVSNSDWTQTKRAAVLLTQAVDDRAGPIGDSGSRIGFVQFALNAQNNYRLNWYQSLGHVQSRINSFRQNSARFAAVGNGLNAAKQQFNWYSTSSKVKVAWLVTNRFSEAGTDAKAVAKQLKNMGVKVFVVGIGEINRWNELKKLATSKGFAFDFKTYNEYRQAVFNAVKKL